MGEFQASLSKSAELLDSSAVGKTATQSELCENMTPAKVPKVSLSPCHIYPSKGVALLPPEHVARKDIEKENKKERKSKGRERATSWNMP